MSRSRSLVCLSVALALVASGCGESTKTASTSATASTPAATSTPAGTSTPASTSTSAGTTAPATESPHAVQGTGSTESHTQSQPKASNKAAKAPVKKATVKPPANILRLPAPRFLYPKKLRRMFVAACEAAQGSPAACECVIAKQAAGNAEKGQLLSEVLALEAVILHGGTTLEQASRPGGSPPIVQRNLAQCLSADQ